MNEGHETVIAHVTNGTLESFDVSLFYVISDDSKNSLLWRAYLHEQLGSLKWLLDHGADPNDPYGFVGSATTRIFQTDRDISLFKAYIAMLSYNQLNQLDSRGKRPLDNIYAYEYDVDRPRATIMIEAGAMITCTDPDWAYQLQQEVQASRRQCLDSAYSLLCVKKTKRSHVPGDMITMLVKIVLRKWK